MTIGVLGCQGAERDAELGRQCWLKLFGVKAAVVEQVVGLAERSFSGRSGVERVGSKEGRTMAEG